MVSFAGAAQDAAVGAAGGRGAARAAHRAGGADALETHLAPLLAWILPAREGATNIAACRGHLVMRRAPGLDQMWVSPQVRRSGILGTNCVSRAIRSGTHSEMGVRRASFLLCPRVQILPASSPHTNRSRLVSSFPSARAKVNGQDATCGMLRASKRTWQTLQRTSFSLMVDTPKLKRASRLAGGGPAQPPTSEVKNMSRPGHEVWYLTHSHLPRLGPGRNQPAAVLIPAAAPPVVCY